MQQSLHDLFGILANKVWGIIITRYFPFSQKKPILKSKRQKDDQKRSKSQLII